MNTRNLPLQGLDLNLLNALHTLLETASVTAAADRLGISQPAMSQSLRRLREMFGDPLLVRGRNGMVLTPRAESLREPLFQRLLELQELVLQTQSFDPAASSREFSVSATDFLQILFLPAFTRILQEEAPQIDLRIRTAMSQQYGNMLEAGELDLMLGSVLLQEHPGLKRRQLGREPLMCAVRRDHPRISDRLTLEEYLAETHILVSPTQSTTPGLVDARLEARGYRRRIVVRLSSFLIAPYIVQSSDHVLTAPRRVIDSARDALGLQVFSPPIELETLPIWMLWHERSQGDPAQRWLRDTVVRAYQQQAVATGVSSLADAADTAELSDADDPSPEPDQQ